jgi:alkylation response protein AidB-like acyl-CoA dehydrogenase
MRAVLAMTVEYLRTREQFGVKIGSFQVLQHRAVDMFVETELAYSAMLAAAIRLSDPDLDPTERRSAVSAAKVQLAESGRFVTQQAIQLHGGIGITDEHDVGLYFKRMHALCSVFGDAEHHVARLAALS